MEAPETIFVLKFLSDDLTENFGHAASLYGLRNFGPVLVKRDKKKTNMLLVTIR